MQTVSKGKHIAGWIITGLVSLLFLLGAVGCFVKSPQTVQGMAKYGFAGSTLPILGTLMLLCAVFYLIPRTAVFGAVLMTAWLGGAVVTHIRASENAMAFAPVLFAGFVWLGVYLREPRLHHVLPVRK